MIFTRTEKITISNLDSLSRDLKVVSIYVVSDNITIKVKCIQMHKLLI